MSWKGELMLVGVIVGGLALSIFVVMPLLTAYWLFGELLE